LKAAGVPYRDASDRVADFHALRHSYITILAMSRAPVKVVQSLARHSTPTLTLNTYSHVGLYDQSAALNALPDLNTPPSKTEPAALAATGTDGPISELLSLHFPYGGDGTGRNLSVTGEHESLSTASKARSSMSRDSLENKAFDARGRVLTDAVGPPDGVKVPAGVEPASAVLQTAAWPSGSGTVVVETNDQSAGAQGFEPCPRVLEARCSPRSTPLFTPPSGHSSSDIDASREGGAPSEAIIPGQAESRLGGSLFLPGR
jgi:hypothetical protein